MREKISLMDDVTQMVSKLSEGNPGAITAMMAVLQTEDASPLDLLHLDDMNIRGPQIWVGFKYHCGGDAKRFIECLRKRDADMVEAINKEMAYDKNFKHTAVTGGASFR